MPMMKERKVQRQWQRRLDTPPPTAYFRKGWFHCHHRYHPAVLFCILSLYLATSIFLAMHNNKQHPELPELGQTVRRRPASSSLHDHNGTVLQSMDDWMASWRQPIREKGIAFVADHSLSSHRDEPHRGGSGNVRMSDPSLSNWEMVTPWRNLHQHRNRNRNGNVDTDKIITTTTTTTTTTTATATTTTATTLPRKYTPLSFGFVMRDFARRVLSRHISSSNVLVIAPDATSAAIAGMEVSRKASRQQTTSKTTIQHPYDNVDFQSPYSIGGTFLLHAALEGHDLHAIDFGRDDKREVSTSWGQSLDNWWESFGDHRYATKTTRTVAANLTSTRWSSTSSTPQWIIAAIFDHMDHSKLDLVDQIWAGADRFLNESTITYVVVALHSRKTGELNYEYGGLAAAKALLDHRYKLQTLQLSHYHVDPGTEPWVEAKYGPNALFKGLENVQDLLRWGADIAERYSGSKDGGEIFTAYVFATQGLDLAIPSRRIFVNDHHDHDYAWRNAAIREEKSPSTPQEIKVDKKNLFKKCPQATVEPKLNILFTERLGETFIQVTIFDDKFNQQIRIYRHRSIYHEFTNPGESKPWERSDDLKLWVSNCDWNKAEAACARFSNYTKCTTRVLLTTDPTPASAKLAGRDQVPNILLILIDPISRPHFHRTMPQTARSLKVLNFVHFGNFTAIGPNSGKNQAGLYSGMPLADRDGIKKDAEGGKWLWDVLRDNGFVTLKIEDGCIENSNMIKRLKPNTTHGGDLAELFCFDFDRPSCVGPDLAASLVMNYGEEFIWKYEEHRKQKDPSLRWAAFLHFVDTHEDTLVMPSMLDTEMALFLERLADLARLNDTLVIVTSDHGLHYGPYFQSRSGRREATEPVLYLRVPPPLQVREDMAIFNENAGMWTTAFDVHETMLSLSVPSKEARGLRKGSTFFQPFPEQRKSCTGTAEIPAEYCGLKSDVDATHSTQSCTKMPRPPSILSFYSDIPPSQRSQFPMNCMPVEFQTILTLPVNASCHCATSHRGWYNCTEHPWESEEVHSNRSTQEYFALVDCPGQTMMLNTRVALNRDLLNRMQPRQVLPQEVADGPPNIILIEIGSATLAFADRHLPKTRAFVKQYHMRQTTGGQVKCTGGICAPNFNFYSLSGQRMVESQERYAASHLFDIAKKLGYVTFTGQELCHDGLPFVTENATVSLSADFELNRLYCRLQESRQDHDPAHGPRLCTSPNIGSGPKATHSGWDLMREIWHALVLAESPKFFYLNIMAENFRYPNPIKRISIVEQYDVYLAAFLRSMTSHSTFMNTIIIIRPTNDLQVGLVATEYSEEVERREPWAQMILPRKLIHSMDSIFHNQDRIVTNHDIYRTLREFLDLRTKESPPNVDDGAGVPWWSYNVLRDPIPVTRTCTDARVPLDSCPCEEQAQSRPPLQ